MKILVTGGSGYIGAHVMAELLERGYEVANLDRAASNLSISANFVGDLADNEFVERTFNVFRPEATIHLAGNSNMANSFVDPSRYVKNVLDCVSNIVTAAVAVDCRVILYSSSCSVYGNKLDATENSRKQPLSPYAASKSLAEDLLEFFVEFLKLRVGIFRFFNVVGCRSDLGLMENHEPESHILPILVKAALSGDEVTIFGGHTEDDDPTGLRDYIDVSDLTNGMLLGLHELTQDDKPCFEKWNLGSTRSLSSLQLLKLVENQVGKRIKYTVQGARPGDPHEVSASSKKAWDELGWKAKIPIQKSILDVMRSEAKFWGLE